MLSAQQGILFVVGAAACFASLDTTTKFISAAVPVAMLMWARFALQTFSTLAVMGPKIGKRLWRTRRPGLQVARGMLLVASSTLAFFSLQMMPVENFTAIALLTPLLMTLIAATSLGERVSILRWLLVLAGFAGAMLVVRPGSESFAWPSLLPLALVFMSAGYQILTSRLARVDDASTIHFYTGCTGVALATLALPFFWQPILGWHLWLLILLVAVCSNVGHLMLILGYARAPVATLTPYLYMQIPFAMLGSWLVFAKSPDRWSVLGIIVIALAGVVGTWVAARERHRDVRVILDT
jgi:drug/metabolite transporter (DMT)-like permease